MGDLKTPFGRLKPEVLERMRSQTGYFPIHKIIEQRVLQETGESLTRHDWAFLREGGTVPASALSVIARSVHPEGTHTAEDIADPVAESDEQPKINALSASFTELFAGLGGYFKPPSQRAFVRNEADLREWVDGILDTCGRWQDGGFDRRMSRADALANAERIMQMSGEKYLGSVRASWEMAPRSVMFACAGGLAERVGLCMTTPLRPAAAADMLAGKLDPFELNTHHMLLTSPDLLIAAAMELSHADRRASKRAAAAIMQTLLYQWGTVGEPGAEGGSELRLISFAGYAEAEARLRVKGFQPSGARTPRAEHAIFVYVRPGWRSVIAALQYRIMMAFVRGYHDLERADETCD